ncbi:MAG: amidohydrolase family protein [Myxococcota bacterium]
MESNDILISGARIWDSDHDVITPHSDVLRIRDGRILALGRDALAMGPAETTIELPGRVLVPGLIDAHVHLELDPLLRTPAEQLAVPPEVRIRAMGERARAMLAHGITTARDCGGGDYHEHALRRAIDANRLPGPRLLCCGQPLTTPDGHCAFWGGVVRSRGEIGHVVARQARQASDWIKVMATGGVFTPGSRPRDTQFDDASLAAIVAAARREGLAVAAHCHGTAGIAAALRAGVRTIEHASFAGEGGFGTDPDEDLMRELAAREVWVSPTVNAGWLARITDASGEPTDFFRRMSRCLEQQRGQGVRFIASSDAGIPGVFHHALVDGLRALQRYAGMRPVDVLRAATCEAARALGLERETGRIAPGLSADLLVVGGDPLQDLSALAGIEAVVFRGRWLDPAALRAGTGEDHRD